MKNISNNTLKVLKTVIVNKDAEYLKLLSEICGSNPYINIVATFPGYDEALSYIERYDIDFIILDIDIPKFLYKEIIDRIIRRMLRTVIFFTSAEEITPEIRRHAVCINDGVFPMYRMPMDIHTMIFKAVVAYEKKLRSVLRVQTFDRFEVFCGDEVIVFPNAKAKELFALCVDHVGGQVTMEEAIDKLWPNRPYDEKVKKLYRKAVFCLKNTLEEYTFVDVFKNSRGKCNIMIEGMECDLFEFIKDLRDGIADLSVVERYMPEYSWAEYTIAKLYFSNREND